MVKLFQYRHPIHLTVMDHQITRTNLPMNGSDFKIYQGVGSNIDFVIRNNDRKPIDLTGKELSLNVHEVHGYYSLLVKPLQVMNAAKGMCRASFVPTDTSGWHPGYYRYNVLIADENGNQEPLYVNFTHDAIGYMEVMDGVTLTPVSAVQVEMAFDKLTPYEHMPDLDSIHTTRFTTGAIAVKNENPKGLHTVAIYGDNYTGRLWMQGSLTNEPSQQHGDWFNLQVQPGNDYLSFDGFAGVDSFNFNANFRWLRFILEPHKVLNKGQIPRLLIKS